MIDFTQHFATRLRRVTAGIAGRTPQAEPIPGSTQLPNSAGGHAWAVDGWTRLDRFLVLGSEGGTFYVGERALTVENATAVRACIAEDGPRVVRRVVEVSAAGRAPTNDPALFVLAMAAGVGDDATRAAALAALPAVARTGTHLFHWLRYVKAFRGWGRGVRSAVGRWYTAKSPTDLAYQLLKYPSRDGWAHRDALRLAHPKAPTVAHDLLFRYAVKGWEGVLELKGVADLEVVQRVEAVQALRQMAPNEAARVIEVYKLTREMVPTELLTHAVVWEALLTGMPLTALVRNLGVMTKVGLLASGSDAARTAVARLGDRDALRKARVHPLQLLAALKTYAQGRGMKGSGTWAPVAQVVDALDGAFYLAFENAPSTGKRVMLALDVSGSMGSPVHGMPYLSCREASAAMALVTAATEPDHRFVAFTQGTYPSQWSATHGSAYDTGLSPLAVSPRQRLDDVVKAITGIPFGGTDCALPMVEAAKRGWAVDVFVVYTDSETWAGAIHPAQALRAYRERTGIPARLVVVGMASNGFSIADPDDAGMLDVVGFDTATPQVISDFAAG
ncbi:MAG: Prophage Clp protease-like protein [uncultured Gemmatimonadaceae bacterium]|uniref:Prophage Clp protease-like protein n=1 Tax=uncultured Gemmatimonadaceae bacterium TaxID=246130 RepID=A0A6J4K5N4_9BACT|nr:MAG: Prophage Clp protease-like protein [uncultured Gemmatimonadaceae bacterium]